MQDLPRLLEIYQIARDFMKANNNPKQWGDAWPPKSLTEKSISNGSQYVCENNGLVIGTFFFRSGKNIEPTYNKIQNGHWLNDEPYGVVHRLAGDGSVKGIGAFCLNWCYEQCRHLRIDTHPDNLVMRNLLLKLGFTYCGIIFVEHDAMPRLAFEK